MSDFSPPTKILVGASARPLEFADAHSLCAEYYFKFNKLKMFSLVEGSATDSAEMSG
jgi:hypothetical protein